MEEVQNEQVLVENNAKLTEVEQNTTTEASFGKFKDANALLNAYNSLEAEFTKRCQRIKELEGKAEKTVISNNVPGNDGEVSNDGTQGTNQVDKEKILQDYLKGIIDLGKKVVFLDGDGIATKTNVEKPKSIDEAGSLAKSIFNY